MALDHHCICAQTSKPNNFGNNRFKMKTMQSIKVFAYCAFFQLTTLTGTWMGWWGQTKQGGTFSRGLQATLSPAAYFCIKSEPWQIHRKMRMFLLVSSSFCPASFPMCGGGGWERGGTTMSFWSLDILSACLGKWLEEAQSEQKIILLPVYCPVYCEHILLDKPIGRVGGVCTGGQEVGRRGGGDPIMLAQPVLSSANFHYSANLGGTASWLVLMEAT